MIAFKFQVNDLPPSVNKMYRPSVSRYGVASIKKNPEAGIFERSAWAEIKAPKEPYDVKLMVSVLFEIKDAKQLKTCDIDNMLKCLFDTLQKIGVVTNDKLFYRIRDIEKRQAKKDRVTGFITEYEPCPLF